LGQTGDTEIAENLADQYGLVLDRQAVHRNVDGRRGCGQSRKRARIVGNILRQVEIEILEPAAIMKRLLRTEIQSPGIAVHFARHQLEIIGQLEARNGKLFRDRLGEGACFGVRRGCIQGRLALGRGIEDGALRHFQQSHRRNAAVGIVTAQVLQPHDRVGRPAGIHEEQVELFRP